MYKKIKFLDIPLDILSMEETIDEINKAILSNKQVHHCVLNAGKVVKIQNDKILKESVVSSDIVNADGMSIVWAVRFLGYKVKERVAGIDLMESLVKLAHEKNYTCFFLGAKEEVVSKVVANYSAMYSKSIIAGYRNGFFEENDEKDIVRKIKQSSANFLFVAITTPKKEIFLNKYKNEFKNVNLIMGVGGSFDVVSGNIKRAPKWMQKIGFEWFFRFIQEPVRMWKRYLIGNFRFIIIFLRFYLKKLLT